jgi:hypothetical protein
VNGFPLEEVFRGDGVKLAEDQSEVLGDAAVRLVLTEGGAR